MSGRNKPEQRCPVELCVMILYVQYCCGRQPHMGNVANMTAELNFKFVLNSHTWPVTTQLDSTRLECYKVSPN